MEIHYSDSRPVRPRASEPVATVTIEGNVCDYCRLMLYDCYHQSPNGGHQVDFCDSLAELRERTSGGCDLCRIIYQHVVYSAPKLDDVKGPIWICWSYFEREEVEQLVVGHPGGATAYLLQPLESTCTATMNIHNPFENKRSYNSLLTTIEGWTQACIKQHRACQQTGPTEMPIRLVDLGDEALPKLPGSTFVRVVETTNIQPQRYAALSYCWGWKGNNLKTTGSNYSQMASQIPDDALPATIRDAVKITRSLGVRYLWVDALCIKQAEFEGDPASDFATEAPKMASYYGNAFFTIGATGATDCNDGFLKPRPALEYPPNGSVKILYYRGTSDRRKEMHIYPPQPLRAVCVDNSPLLRRGWCVQERAFSRRCLFFARDCLIWECADSRSSEFAPEVNLNSSATKDDWDSSMTRSGNDILMKQGSLQAVPKDQLLASAWFGMVCHYSQAEFTFLADRLIAISSLVNKIAGLAGGHYDSGCWLETIDRCLAWRVEPNASSGGALPSWSWASLTGQITYVSAGQWTGLVTLREDFSQHKIGRLRLRGSMWRSSLSELGLRPRLDARHLGERRHDPLLWWDQPDPKPRDELAVLDFLDLGSNQHGVYSLVLQRMRREDGGGQEFKRLGCLLITPQAPRNTINKRAGCCLDLV